MTARLKYTLVVQHPDTLLPVVLVAGEPVPEWAEHLAQADDFEAGDVDGGTPPAGKPPTNAELEEEIARRNDGRADEDLIVPDGKTKADLLAALAADDAKSAKPE